MKHKPQVIFINNQLQPQDRIIEYYEQNTPISSIAKAHSKPYICLYNDNKTPILRRQWGDIHLKNGDIVIFLLVMTGGGGDSKDVTNEKNPFLIISGLALIAGGFAFTSGYLAYGIVGGGIALVGSGLFGTPTTDTSLTKDIATPSPTYSNNKLYRSNRIRYSEAIPVSYGRNKIIADKAITDYVDFTNGQEAVHMLLCLGQGEYEIEDILYGNDRMSRVPYIDYRIQYLNQNDTFDTSLVDPNIIVPKSFEIKKLETTYSSDYALTPAGFISDTLITDIIGNGTYDIRVIEIDKKGNYVGGYLYVKLGVRVTGNRGSEITKLSNGKKRYAVSLKSTSGNLTWYSLRAVVDEVHRFDNLTMLSVVLKSTDKFKLDKIDTISVITQRKLRTYDKVSNSWTQPIVTNSLVWAVSDMITSRYGGNHPDKALDLDNFVEIDEELRARGDELNIVIDSTTTLQEVVSKVTQIARCTPVVQLGKISLVRDRRQTVPVAMFSPMNIVEKSFSINWTSLDNTEFDGVSAKFINSDTWNEEYIYIKYEIKNNKYVLSKVNFLEQPIELDLTGCTNKRQALAEAEYTLKNTLLRRTSIKLTTEMEGNIVTIGDRVLVSHDIMEWGTSGKIEGFDGKYIYLSEDIEFNATDVFLISFRNKNGSASVQLTVSAYDDVHNRILIKEPFIFSVSNDQSSATLRFTNGNTIILNYGHQMESTHYIYAKKTLSEPMVAVVQSKRPIDDMRVEVVMKNEDDEVHVNSLTV